MKPLLLACLLLIATTCTAQSYYKEFSRIKYIIKDRIDNHQVPSISIAVVKGNNILWEESFGYADKEQQQKATVNTPYYLASISKTMTATAIMKLARRKMIRLDSPANKYMRYTEVNGELWDARKATIKTLLTHTSGITSYGYSCTLNTDEC